jgi:hypothetical protein
MQIEGEGLMKHERTISNVIKRKRAPFRVNAASFVGRHGIDTRLEIPPGEPDLDRLRSVTREWLVPLLVDEFLRERGIDFKQKPMTVNPQNQLSNAPIRGGRGAFHREE